jgi:hypothetical protein
LPDRYRFWGVLAGLGVILMLGVSVSYASEADMLNLPSYSRYGCLNCHNGAGATESFVPEGAEGLELNVFGVAWLENGQTWDEMLADLNPDNDGCTNGFELGDPSGTWRPGQARPDIDPQEQSNPGNASDCALPLNEASWGVLKGLFGDQ